MYVEQTEIAMAPSCTFIRQRQKRRAVVVAVEVKPVRNIQPIQLALHIMKRPWLTESLAAKRQCLVTTSAMVKDAMTLCQNKSTQYEKQKKAHGAEIQERFEAQIQPQTTTSYFGKIHGAGCTHTVDQLEVPSRYMKRPCRHCTGRTSVLPEAEGPIIATTEIPISDHDMHSAGHDNDIIQLWMDILRTKKLRLGFIVHSAVREQWMCFPLRNMRPMCSRPSSHFHSTTTSIVDNHDRVIPYTHIHILGWRICLYTPTYIHFGPMYGPHIYTSLLVPILSLLGPMSGPTHICT